MKVGLVLEGGGLRGAYTAGVLKWFVDNEIPIDYAVGISSGAMYLCYYMMADGNLLKDTSVKWAGAEFEKGIKPLLREGNFVAYNKLFDVVLKSEAPFDLEKIKNSPIKGEFAVYDLADCTLEWHDTDNIDKDFMLIKAACTLPLASKSVIYKGTKLIDGGVVTMIPIERSIHNGCDKHIVISTKPDGYVRPEASFGMKLLFAIFYRKYKKLRQAIDNRAKAYNREVGIIDGLINEGKALRINPRVDSGIGRLGGDIEKLEQLFQSAYQDCEDRREEILEFVGK